MKILVSYRGIPQSPNWATGDMVVKAFRALGHEAYPYAKYYQQNRWVEGKPGLDEHEWDLVLFMECNDGDGQYPELRIVRSRKMACWLFDTSYHPDRYRGLVDYFGFDHVFLANPLTILDYKVWGYKNVTYLPYACDRDLHARPLEYPKTRDVALVGSVRDDRIALVSELANHGVSMELIGGVFREEYIDALASSRIIVNQNPDAGRGLLNMRFFEASAAGSIVFTELSDYVPNQATGLNKVSCTYDTIDELAFKIRSMLETPGLIDNRIVSDQADALAFNSYENRCQTILDTVSDERN